jgi:hypothetical protein
MDDVYEDNDELISAAPLDPRGLTEPLNLAICEGDDDYFVIQGCVGAELQLTLTQVDPLSDLDMRLVAQDGRQFAASATPDPVESLRYVFSADHAAYLMVYGFQGSEGGYELSASLSACAVMSECSSDQDCASGERCEAQRCVEIPPECTQDGDCFPDECCLNERCELRPPQPECSDDLDCLPDERCLNERCELRPPQPECSTYLDCLPTEDCLEGFCVEQPAPECASDLDCLVSERCEAGSCVPVPPDYCESDFDCLFLESCLANRCVPLSPDCLQHSDCGVDEVCNAGSCFYEPAECVTVDDCLFEDSCTSERCLSFGRSSDACAFDSDCGPISTCEAGSCVAPSLASSCSVNSDCGLYQRCDTGSCVYVADRIEDDDDLAGAELLSSNLYGHLTIEEDDDDWIAIDVCAGGTLDAEIRFTDSLGDLDMTLYDASESYLAGSGSTTDHERIDYVNEGAAARLYLKVYGFLGATNSYDLSLRVSGCEGGYEQDSLEDNDSASEAPYLSAGYYSDLTVTERDSDWYSAELCAGGTLRVGLYFSDLLGDVDMKLYDAAEEQLSISASGTDNEQISYTAPSAGRLFWKVYGYNGAENSYEMSVSIEGCGPESYLEPDPEPEPEPETSAPREDDALWQPLTLIERS